MLFSDMVQEVINIVQDSSFDDAIPGYINEAFLQASGRVNIPDLKRIGIASTVVDQMYTPLYGVPGGFSGRLTKILNTDVLRYANIETMTSAVINQGRALDEVGAVEMVALEGRNLWYYPTPETAQSIQCVMFSDPPVLIEDTDEPNFFPGVCHRNIGIHGAAFLAYGIIENDMTGPKVNTEYHFGMFEKGITQLVEWVARHRVHMISSSYDDTVVSTTAWNSSFARW